MNDLLLLVHRIPYPPNKGDKVRSYNLLKYLAQHYRVHLGTFVDAEEDWQYVDKVKEYCYDSYFARLNPRSARIRSLRGLLDGTALTLPYYFDAALQMWVKQKLANKSINRAVVFSSAMGQYLPREKNEMTRVADLVDVDSDKWAQYAKGKSWPQSWLYRREASRLLAFERQLARDFDSVVLVNEKEAALFQSLAPESAQRISHANNGVDTQYFAPSQDFEDPYGGERRVLVFTGAMDYWPNVDAVEWFAESVFPSILEKFSDARFFVVGSRPDPRVKLLSKLPGVVVTGSVPDIRPYLAHAALAVAPLRIARGTQNKVLEAMAMGKTVIASKEAAQGVSAIDGRELIVANDTVQFIAQIALRLSISNGDGIGSRARECVIRKYSWDANLARIGGMLDPSKSTVESVRKAVTQTDARILALPSRKSA